MLWGFSELDKVRCVLCSAANFRAHQTNSLAWKYLRRMKVDPMEMISSNKAVLGFNLIWMWDQAHLMDCILSDMFEKGNDWSPPLVSQTYPMCEGVAAMKQLQAGKTIGKLVLKINE